MPTSGVPPSTAGHCRDDGDRAPLGNGGLKAVKEADVLISEEDVHETAEAAVGIEHLIAQTRMGVVQPLYYLSHRCPFNAHFRGACR